jgi:hypothetical protein
MKKIMLIGLLLLAGCTKPVNCTHMHIGGALLELCSPNVQCFTSKDKIGTMKTCVYVPPQEEEK